MKSDLHGITVVTEDTWVRDYKDEHASTKSLHLKSKESERHLYLITCSSKQQACGSMYGALLPNTSCSVRASKAIDTWSPNVIICMDTVAQSISSWLAWTAPFYYPQSKVHALLMMWGFVQSFTIWPILVFKPELGELDFTHLY